MPKSPATRVNAFIKLATEGQIGRARELLKHEPGLGRASFHAACVAGETDFLERELRRKPKLAVTPGGPDHCVPLLTAGFSGFLRADSKRAARIVRLVKMLLEYGADPNSVFVCGPKGQPWRLSALYAAAGRANHLGLTSLLLDAGANPNDGESLYHSAEFTDHACTRLLLARGAKINGTNAVHRKLDYDDLKGLRLFLDHGASADLRNGCGDALIHWAISNGRKVRFLRLLADRGADLRARNSEGLTPFQQAARLGHTSAMDFLLGRRAGDRMNPKERFIAACARGDRRVAKSILNVKPRLAASLQTADLGLITSLAWRGKSRAVRVMLAVGFNVAAKGKHGETALHCAAWMGSLPTLEVLVHAGAPLEVKEPQYDATPLQWALHGSVYSRNAEGKPLNRNANHAGVVRALLRAGASRTDIHPGEAEYPAGVRQALRNTARRA